jgi:tyrosyl-tRNA synthetase
VLSFGEWGDLIERIARAGETGDWLECKKALANRLVERFHGAPAASQAAAHFQQVVQRKELPDDIPELAAAAGPEGFGLLNAIVEAGFARSNSEARRAVAQGGVRVDEVREDDPTRRLAPGSHLVQVGKRRFVRVEVS